MSFLTSEIFKESKYNANIIGIVSIVDRNDKLKIFKYPYETLLNFPAQSWDENECANILKDFKKGDKVKVKILDINVEKERISLGIKHLENDPVQEFLKLKPLKSKITGKIAEVNE